MLESISAGFRLVENQGFVLSDAGSPPRGCTRLLSATKQLVGKPLNFLYQQFVAKPGAK